MHLSDTAGTNYFFADATGWSACKPEPVEMGSGPWSYHRDGIHNGDYAWLPGYGEVDTAIFPMGHIPHRAEFYGRLAPAVASIQVTWPQGMSGTAALADHMFLIRGSEEIKAAAQPPAISIGLYDASGALLQTLGPETNLSVEYGRCWLAPAKHIVLGKTSLDPTTCAEAQPWMAPWG